MYPNLAKKSMEQITRLSNLDREGYVAMGGKLIYDPMKVTPSVWVGDRRYLIRAMKTKTKIKTKTKTRPFRSHKACTICNIFGHHIDNIQKLSGVNVFVQATLWNSKVKSITNPNKS